MARRSQYFKEAGLSTLLLLLRPKAAPIYRFPIHGILGLSLVSVAWPASWLQLEPLSEYAFFLLWLGYILTMDALVLRLKRNSLLTRNVPAFCGMFLASIPLWWAFEGLNHFTQNWHYVGAAEYSTLRYALVASWHFTIVVPAVFETAEFIGCFGFIRSFRWGPAVPVSRRLLMGSMALAVLTLASLVVWPQYAFAGTWICLLLLLDPINYLRGRPSVIAWLRRGDWRPVVALALGALVCGWFWEMWNYFAFPKWEYNISYVDFVRVFEMPLLGYGGYLPFGLEAFAVYHFLSGLVRKSPGEYVQIIGLAQQVRPCPKAARATG